MDLGGEDEDVLNYFLADGDLNPSCDPLGALDAFGLDIDDLGLTLSPEHASFALPPEVRPWSGWLGLVCIVRWVRL